MAGGSADAAATLVALDRLWGLESGDRVLFELAAGLGSDVPFGLVGRNALGTGRGEQVEQLPGVEVARWWVVVPAEGEGLATPAVYCRHDELRPEAPPAPPAPHRLVAFLGDPADVLAPLLHNDLQPAALDLRPGLVDLLAAGEAAGALRGHRQRLRSDLRLPVRRRGLGPGGGGRAAYDAAAGAGRLRPGPGSAGPMRWRRR